MKAFAVELRRGPGPWLAPLLAVSGAFIGADQLPTAAVWTYATQAVAASIRLAGPVAAGVAAWAGMRCQRRRTRHLEAMSARPSVAMALTECAALLTWTLGTVVIGTAALFGYTALHATWAGPGWWWIVATLLAYAVHVAVGYAVGRLGPWLLTPPVVLVAFYVLDLLAVYYQGGRWTPLLVDAPYIWLPFDALNTQMLVGQVLWYSALVGLALFLLAARAGSGVRVISGCAAAVAALTAIALPVIATGSTQLTISDQNILFRCAGSDPELCLHPAFVHARPALTAQLAVVQRRLAGTPFTLHRVEQRPRGIGSMPTTGAVAFGLDGFRRSDITEAAAEVVGNEMGDQACGGRLSSSSADHPGAAALEAADLNNLVEAWASGVGTFRPFDATERTAAMRFAALTETGRQHFLTTFASQIRACQLSSADFS